VSDLDDALERIEELQQQLQKWQLDHAKQHEDYQETFERQERRNNELREELLETEWLNGRMGGLLTRTANALKGEPGPLKLHDWSDLPQVAQELVEELNSWKRAAGLAKP
jgi:hypothetical protein